MLAVISLGVSRKPALVSFFELKAHQSQGPAAWLQGLQLSLASIKLVGLFVSFPVVVSLVDVAARG